MPLLSHLRFCTGVGSTKQGRDMCMGRDEAEKVNSFQGCR